MTTDLGALRRMGTYSETVASGDDWADINHPHFYFDPGFKEFCKDKIRELGQLKENWDSEGAPRLDRKILQAAAEFVDSLPGHIAPRPMIVPLSSGGLQFEWHNGEQSLELELENPREVRYLKWNPSDSVEDEEVVGVADIECLTNLIRWFSKGVMSA